MPSNHQSPLHLHHSFPSKMGYVSHREAVTSENCRGSKMLFFLLAITLNLCPGLLACSWVSVFRMCPTWVWSVFFFPREDSFHDQYPRALGCLDGDSPRRQTWSHATKVLLADWSPETTLDLFAPWLFLRSLSWLQIWWEASQRACPQPPVGRTGLACTLQVAWRELQGVGDGHGKETAQKKSTVCEPAAPHCLLEQAQRGLWQEASEH